MGELGGFLRIERSGVVYDDPTQRIEGDRTFKEFLVRRPDADLAHAYSPSPVRTFGAPMTSVLSSANSSARGSDAARSASARSASTRL